MVKGVLIGIEKMRIIGAGFIFIAFIFGVIYYVLIDQQREINTLESHLNTLAKFDTQLKQGFTDLDYQMEVLTEAIHNEDKIRRP